MPKKGKKNTKRGSKKKGVSKQQVMQIIKSDGASSSHNLVYKTGVRTLPDFGSEKHYIVSFHAQGSGDTHHQNDLTWGNVCASFSGIQRRPWEKYRIMNIKIWSPAGMTTGIQMGWTQRSDNQATVGPHRVRSKRGILWKLWWYSYYLTQQNSHHYNYE